MSKKSSDERDDDEWGVWWDARMAAMESVLGPADDTVLHAGIPFEFGFDVGGRADIVLFRHHVEGVGYATSELIGRDDQLANTLGNYELLIFHSEDEDWGADTISALAYYTRDAVINPGETMDLGPAVPDGSSIVAFLFVDYARFSVRKRKAGLLLCVGITSKELLYCRSGKRDTVEKALKAAGVFPFTDLYRLSVDLP